MNTHCRKLKIILNTDNPYKSRVIDVETGDEILFVSQIDIHYDPRTTSIKLTLEQADIEIEKEQIQEAIDQDRLI